MEPMCELVSERERERETKRRQMRDYPCFNPCRIKREPFTIVTSDNDNNEFNVYRPNQGSVCMVHHLNVSNLLILKLAEIIIENYQSILKT